jgi:hypothetical protein
MTVPVALLLATLAQIPTGIPQQPTNNFPDAGQYPQHLLKDSTLQKMAYSRSRDGGPSAWGYFLDEEVFSAPRIALAPAPAPPSGTFPAGTYYFDTACAVIRTYNGSTWSPCPPGPSSTSSVPSAAGPPTGTFATGATYYDTTAGCLRTWSGSAFSACPTQPQVPRILLPPQAGVPTGPFPVGTAVYDTTCAVIRTYNGSAWSACPSSGNSSVATAMQQNASPPTLPANQANANKGNVYFDTSLACVRETRDGLNWGECLTTQKCVAFTITGLSIPVLGVSTAPQAVPFTGAIANTPCHVTRSTGGTAPAGARADCAVSTTPNQLTVQWVSNTGALSAVLSIPNGTYYACSEVIW